MAVAPADLAFAREGQEVRVHSGTREASGKIVALSPVIDPDTRSAKAIAEIDNTSGAWKLGDFVEARLIGGRAGRQPHRAARGGANHQGQQGRVRQRGAAASMARPVTTGREDSPGMEILSGLEFGEPIAVKNTFTLKAELGKAEAEHQH